MSFIEIVVLGVLQGFTEFLPISSSAVILLTPLFFNWSANSLEFDIALHAGSLMAILWAFRKEIKSGLTSRVWLTNIAIASAPLIFVVLIIPDNLLLALRDARLIAFTLVFWGIFLWLADIYQKRNKNQISIMEISPRKAIFIGLFQALALIPGSSRSGMTMTAGLFTNLNRAETARFSFLLSIPALFGAAIFGLKEIVFSPLPIDYLAMISGALISFLTGIATIHFFMKYIQTVGYWTFAIIRFMMAILIIAFLI
jgi:undecaprenyl-diphosphatase